MMRPFAAACVAMAAASMLAAAQESQDPAEDPAKDGASARAREVDGLRAALMAAKDEAAAGAAREALATYAERNWDALRKDALAPKGGEGAAAARALMEEALRARIPRWASEAAAAAKEMEEKKAAAEKTLETFQKDERKAQTELQMTQDYLRIVEETERRAARNRGDVREEMRIADAVLVNVRANQEVMEASGLAVAELCKHTWERQVIDRRRIDFLITRKLQMDMVAAKPEAFPFGGLLPETFDWGPAVVTFAQRLELKTSFELEDVKLSEALPRLSVLGGVPVVLGKETAGDPSVGEQCVSLRVTEMRIQTAVEWIAKLNELTCRIDALHNRLVLDKKR